ncbi:hypothetical protein DRO69_07215 [Candidatus Bathyarchaeota archaeon]|nr:MAG: hypothetical protein DRO69_07215 [Candidatus Bathyarchaeota archaeon]
MILDVGCGSKPKGDVNVDLFFAPTHRGGEHVAFNPKTIKNFVLADAHYLPFRDEAFNIVYSSHLLEHCLHPFKVLQEFHRVSNSIVYLEIPYGERCPDDCPYHLYSWTSKSFEHLLSKLFPYVQCYCTERIAEKLRSGKKSLFGDLLLAFVRKTSHTLLRRKQISALCRKRK